MATVAIIPARGGSKRIPRKNIKPFLGKPIIAYSIETALQSRLFDEVMVSTEDDEIAVLALQCGAKVPFRRSERASNDFATTTDVLLEVLTTYQSQGKGFEFGCCIYPTAPFITIDLLGRAWQMMIDHAYDTVFPVLRFSSPIQ
ncbi:MAG TPA: pseudaminic acid cytidylyltransferase, partial [Alphaproteobacteria bacterium]|nr:pseudaminic acid cytidylyltransferase [Alphaproteobacteria bacterium]